MSTKSPQGTKPKLDEAQTDRLLVFSIGDQWFAVDIHQARGIEPAGSITPVPGTPPYIAGVYNLRGTLLAVIDLGKLLGLEPSERDSSAHIVVGEAGGFAGGLLVDAVQEIMDVPRAECEPPLSTLDSTVSSYVKGQVQLSTPEGKDGHLVTILDLGRLFQAAVQE